VAFGQEELGIGGKGIQPKPRDIPSAIPGLGERKVISVSEDQGKGSSPRGRLPTKKLVETRPNKKKREKCAGKGKIIGDCIQHVS